MVSGFRFFRSFGTALLHSQTLKIQKKNPLTFRRRRVVKSYLVFYDLPASLISRIKSRIPSRAVRPQSACEALAKRCPERHFRALLLMVFLATWNMILSVSLVS